MPLPLLVSFLPCRARSRRYVQMRRSPTESLATTWKGARRICPCALSEDAAMMKGCRATFVSTSSRSVRRGRRRRPRSRRSRTYERKWTRSRRACRVAWTWCGSSSARSRNRAGKFRSHRSGGSQTWPSASTTSSGPSAMRALSLVRPTVVNGGAHDTPVGGRRSGRSFGHRGQSPRPRLGAGHSGRGRWS